MLRYNKKSIKGLFTILLLIICALHSTAQVHPKIYIDAQEKDELISRLERSEPANTFVLEIRNHIDPFVVRHETDPEWIVSRLQMYWETKYKRIYVNGMDFSHGEGEAPVPTVRFSGSRDWATNYLRPALEDIRPYMDDDRGLYLQNDKKKGKPWEWVKPSETGHIIERINEEIVQLAADAAFQYWLTDEEKYAIFARDIFMKYMEGMYYRDPPLTFEDHKNAKLMGLQTFEVIHERIVEHLTVCYDFLYVYLKATGADLDMIQSVFQKWADQEIKFGVPGNNWNLMQALYITYLALALEDDEHYENGKGQSYYIDQVLNQNTEKQKALNDVVKNYDQQTGVWPEVAGYNMLVGNDMLEIFTLMDRALDNNLVAQYPIIEKANLVIFQYLFPNGFTVAYGDAKHSRMRFNALELLLTNYRKYGLKQKEDLITAQLKRFISDGAYSRDEIFSLFQLFFYVEQLSDVSAAKSFNDLVSPIFYAPNVSWVVQRNGNSMENGMMISENASLGNHSHTNGVNMELYAKGMVIAPDCAAGVSYWSKDHIDYYSRFPAHNTVVVDGRSDYRNMRGSQAFELDACYPSYPGSEDFIGDFTFSHVSFTEPSTDALQQRLLATVRTSNTSGYFIDIFRSARKDGQDKKHEYLFHGQGNPISFLNPNGQSIATKPTDELSSKKGDLVGFDYYEDKESADYSGDFVARFNMPSILNEDLIVNLWMKGYGERKIFKAVTPYSRAIHSESVPASLYHKLLPTLVVRQLGEAALRPFVTIIDPHNEREGGQVKSVNYFMPNNAAGRFVGIKVSSANGRIDHIYNDTDGENTYTFSDGTFRGTFAICSIEEGKIHSMFLGDGLLLQKDTWKIETKEEAGSVLVLPEDEQLRIDAAVPFFLTVPIPKKAKKSRLAILDQEGKEITKGEFVKKKKLAVFELPALDDALIYIKH